MKTWLNKAKIVGIGRIQTVFGCLLNSNKGKQNGGNKRTGGWNAKY